MSVDRKDMANDPVVRKYALTTSLPNVETARLPATYEQAKTALERAQSIDECREWKNKAEAIASYARQAGDETLTNLAATIRLQAHRRCGELMREIEASKGGRPPEKPTQPPRQVSPSRSQAARDAGMSRHQKETALQLAAIPKADFDKAVEKPGKPPTITELAKMGTKPQPKVIDVLEGRDPKDYAAATHALGTVQRMAEFAGKHAPAAVVRGLKFERERRDLRADAERALAWLSDLLAEMERGGPHA